MTRKRKSETIRLQGYSGYDVLLVEDGADGPVVTKKSQRSEQNERLRKQYEKHRFFAENPRGPFRVPPLRDSGYDRGLFYYRYRYIEGVTLLHFIETADQESIRTVLDRLLGVMKAMAAGAVHFEKAPPPHATLGKSLKAKIAAKISETPLDPRARRRMLDRSRDFADHRLATVCHGDFTFDNIIVDRDLNLWFLDFLELFYPHHWLDFGKLFQDVDAGWYELKYGMRLPYNKLAYARERLLRGIAEFDPEYPKHHSFFLAVNLLRNLPYLKDREHRKKVAETISFLVS